MREYLEHLVSEISQSALESTLLPSITGLFALLALRILTDSLMKMHRSKSALKKINKQYSFGKKVMMMPAWDHCMHAPRFCRFLICCHHARCCLYLISLVLCVIHLFLPFFAVYHAWFSVAVCFLFDAFALVLNLILLRNPFVTRKNAYRFEKYHNTDECNKLF